MRTVLIALALIVASAFPALAIPAGGGSDAIANNTTTSMGQPMGSPFYAAPRSAGVPDTPARRRAIELGQSPVLVARCGTFHPYPGCRPTP